MQKVLLQCIWQTRVVSKPQYTKTEEDEKSPNMEQVFCFGSARYSQWSAASRLNSNKEWRDQPTVCCCADAVCSGKMLGAAQDCNGRELMQVGDRAGVACAPSLHVSPSEPSPAGVCEDVAFRLVFTV